MNLFKKGFKHKINTAERDAIIDAIMRGEDPKYISDRFGITIEAVESLYGAISHNDHRSSSGGEEPER